MGLTRFPHGVSSYGIPILGTGARYTGWWGTTSRFVDYDYGSDGNSGTEPTDAYKNLQTAIDASSIGDVIYIRNRDQDTTSTDPEYIIPASTTNWSVAEAKTHLSIIGAAPTSHLAGVCGSGNMAIYLRGNATATTGPVMDWKGAFGLIENIAWHRGAVTSGSILKLNGNSTSLRAANTVIANCLFRMDSNTGGSIYNVDNWWVTIYGCTFHDCKIGIYLHGSSSTIRRTTIDSCNFRNQTAASVDQNILVSGSSTQDVTIQNCTFGCNIPGAGTNLFINFTATATGLVYNCAFCADTVEGTSYMILNGVDFLDCHQARCTADSEAIAGT
jgi:parallel beta-helix repeat protein